MAGLVLLGVPLVLLLAGLVLLGGPLVVLLAGLVLLGDALFPATRPSACREGFPGHLLAERILRFLAKPGRRAILTAAPRVEKEVTRRAFSGTAMLRE